MIHLNIGDNGWSLIHLNIGDNGRILIQGQWKDFEMEWLNTNIHLIWTQHKDSEEQGGEIRCPGSLFLQEQILEKQAKITRCPVL